MVIAAKSMKMSMKEFTKAMENGEISAREFMPVFTKAMQEMAAPGLEKAFKTMNVAWKRMTQNFKLFVKALFESGVGELFTQIFNSLSDIFQMAAPLISLLGAFASTVLKVLIFPIRLAIAGIRDLVMLLDIWMKNTFGTSMNELMAGIGKIGGYIISIFAGVGNVLRTVLAPFIKLFQLIFGKSVMAQVGKASFAAAPQKMQGMISDYAKPIKAGAAKAAEIGGNVMKSRYTTASGAATGAQEAQQYIMHNTQVEFTGEARDALRENKRESTTRKITNNSRG